MTVANVFYDFYVYGFAAIVVMFPTVLVYAWARDRMQASRAANPARIDRRASRARALRVATVPSSGGR